MAFKSFCLVLTMSRTCAFVTLPTLSRLGTPEPLANPAAFFSNTEAGGDLRMKLNERSAYTVMTTGKINPDWSLVLALNSLQKPGILLSASKLRLCYQFIHKPLIHQFSFYCKLQIKRCYFWVHLLLFLLFDQHELMIPWAYQLLIHSRQSL